MKNQNRTRSSALPNSRRLCLERLESRLPFVIDAIPIEVDAWLIPVTERPWFIQEQWISSLNIDSNELNATASFDVLTMDVAYLVAELFGTTNFYGHIPDGTPILAEPLAMIGTTAPITEVILPTKFDLIEAAPSLFNSSDSLAVDLSIGQWDDPIFPQGLEIPVNIARILSIPTDADSIEGLAVPAGELTVSIFEGDAGVVEAITTPATDSGTSIIATQLPRAEQTALVSVRIAPMKRDGNSLGSSLTIHQLNESRLQMAPAQFYKGSFGELSEQTSSFIVQGFSQPSHVRQVPQYYQTLGELLQRNGVQPVDESQLVIEKEQGESPSSSRRQTVDYGYRIDIAPETVVHQAI